MERYRAYKDSGVEWIGMIPEGWDTVQAGRVIATRSGKPCIVFRDESHGQYPVYGGGSCTGYTSDANVNAGTVIVGRVGGNEVRYADCECWATDNALIVSSGLCGRYTYYTLCSMNLEALVTSTSQPLLNGSSLRKGYLVVPSSEEQKAIADYLDAKTAGIDALVADCEYEVELLREYRRAIISEVVTKGLDPDAPMKDSGVEWIGEIPLGWKCIKAKYVVKISNGSDPTTEGNTPVFGSGESSFKTCGEYKEPPATLIGRKGATLHIPHFMTERYWNVDTAFNVNAKTGFLDKYYYYLAMNFDYKSYLSHTTLPSMTQTAYENMFLPYPSFEEQCSIVDYLGTKTAEIDSLIEAKQVMVDKLREYRKSLISEAVTGKFKVPRAD